MTAILRTTFQIGGHDIPADPAFGQMIGGRKTARKGIGVFEGRRSSQTKTQMFRDQRHRRDQRKGVVNRYLRGLMDNRLIVAVVAGSLNIKNYCTLG